MPLARALGVSIALSGALVLIGWAADVALLRSVFSHWSAVAPNTALAFILLGTWLCLSESSRVVFVWRLVLAAVVVLLAGGTLSQYVGGWDLGLDHIVFDDPGRMVHTQFPGRMSFATAVALLLLGLGFSSVPLRRCIWLRHTVAVTVGTIALLALAGHFYSTPSLNAVGPYTGIAVPTTIVLMLIAAGLIAVDADAGLSGLLGSRSAGAAAARRLLPVALVLPLAIGWARLAGERAGLYETSFGVALTVAAQSLVLFIAGWWTSAALHRSHEAERKAHHALGARERLLDAILEQLPVGVWISDAAGNLERGNPAAQRIWQGARYVPPKDYGEYRGWWRDTGKRIAADEWALARAIQHGTTSLNEEVDIECFDGTRKVILNSCSPIYDDVGVLSGAVVTNLDITDRIRAEERLVAALEELQRSNGELERFAYVASHDLQEPLRMVSSFTQLLARKYKGRLDAKADEYIGYAVDGAARMQVLIDDLLMLSRVGTRGNPLVATDCTEVAQRCLRDLRLSVEEAGAEVTIGPLPLVYADGGQLGQVFQNLISNALRFRGPDPPRIQVSAEHTGTEWVLSVRDNGIGIAREHFDRIFVIFQRLNPRDRYPGTGIGLAVCKKIVERHGGRIWVESTPGQGSTFHFTLREAQRNAA